MIPLSMRPLLRSCRNDTINQSINQDDLINQGNMVYDYYKLLEQSAEQSFILTHPIWAFRVYFHTDIAMAKLGLVLFVGLNARLQRRLFTDDQHAITLVNNSHTILFRKPSHGRRVETRINVTPPSFGCREVWHNILPRLATHKSTYAAKADTYIFETHAYRLHPILGWLRCPYMR